MMQKPKDAKEKISVPDTAETSAAQTGAVDAASTDDAVQRSVRAGAGILLVFYYCRTASFFMHT
jgi:hypothetical protein